MEITIQFYSGFEVYLKGDSNKVLSLKLNGGEDVVSILRRFLPNDAISFVGMVLVNKRITDFNYQVVEGDMIEIFPIIGGG